MYTQCPECQTAFRVTARVLQQASGRVRCGGCGNAFNALEFLSEELPVVRDDSGTQDADAQSKKLLDTLNQLAGPENVVIEDTGVEWQVLDEGEDDEATGEHPATDTGTMRWTLQDVEDESEAVPEIVDEVPLASAEAQSADEDVMRFDDNTPLPDDFDNSVTASTPQRRQQDAILIESQHFDEMQIDLALAEPDDWVDLLEEVEDEDSNDDPGISIEVEEELAAIHNELNARPAASHSGPDRRRRDPEPPEDVESQFDSQAEALGLEASGAHDVDYDEDDGIEMLPPDPDVPGLETTGEFEEQIKAARAALRQVDSDDMLEDEVETGEYPLAVDDLQHAPGEDNVAATADGDTADEDDIAELILRGELEAAEIALQDSDLSDAPEDEDRGDTRPLEDEAPPARTSKYPEHLFDENADNVETIIMEGDFVHGSLHEQMRDATNRSRTIDEAAYLMDTYSTTRETIRGGRRKSDPPGLATIAAAVVLALVLAGQVVHHSRQALSTTGAFNQTIAPLYRLAGYPITPQWNIKGWQFQATSGATDENEQLLTIYSTVANRSSQALPYPLIHLSLTDRWEEITGSRVLEPKEYLAGDLDPRTPVAAGDKFTAVISINAPSPDATGFKLNVCYRAGPGQVRCATEDFKE